MKTTRNVTVIAITIISFAIYYGLFTYFQEIKSALDNITKQGLISYVITYFIIGIPIFVGCYFIDSQTSVIRSLGLSENFLKAVIISCLFTLPMFIGGFYFFKWQQQIAIQQLIAGTFIAGLVEELFFRGFLYGMLFKKTDLGFLLAIVLGALLFAFGHLYQSRDSGEMIGIFFITFAGAIFFAWLYVEWHYNLWVPIFTHALMNLSWHVFAIDDSALGGTTANILRGLTITLAIIFTVVYKKKHGQSLAINRKTILFKRRREISQPT